MSRMDLVNAPLRHPRVHIASQGVKQRDQNRTLVTVSLLQRRSLMASASSVAELARIASTSVSEIPWRLGGDGCFRPLIVAATCFSSSRRPIALKHHVDTRAPRQDKPTNVPTTSTATKACSGVVGKARNAKSIDAVAATALRYLSNDATPLLAVGRSRGRGRYAQDSTIKGICRTLDTRDSGEEDWLG